MIRGEMMDRMGSAEFQEQAAFDRIEPIDDPYWRTALLCLTLTQAFGGKGARRVKHADFMPFDPERRRRQMKPASGPAVFAALDKYAAATGGLKSA